MKLFFLIGIIPILFLSSVCAVDVTTCQNISTGGNYRFVGNITVNDGDCGFGNGCILINASSVTLDLKGYGLINNGSCSYGIVLLPKDVNDFSDTWVNLNILNGEIIGFPTSAIELVGGVTGDITYLNIYSHIGIGDGIALDTPYNDIIIGENWFINVNNAVIGDCGLNCRLYDNEIRYATNGFYLNGNGFDIQRNLIGYSDRNLTECFETFHPTEFGIFCNNCTNSIIRNNDIMADNALSFTNYAHDNNITDNTLRTFYNFQPLIVFDSTTDDNIFCNNQVITSNPTSVFSSNTGLWECFFGTQVNNAKDLVTDTGTNTVNEFCTTNCLQNWYCNGTYRIYINNACSITLNHTCQYGCESGIYGSYCIGTETYPEITTSTIPLEQQYNISYYEPVINQTDLQDAGVTFLTPFFTPFFLIIMVQIIICSVMTFVSKQPTTFPIMIFITGATFGVLHLYGEYSYLIAGVICIISAGIGAGMFKTATHG